MINDRIMIYDDFCGLNSPQKCNGYILYLFTYLFTQLMKFTIR